MRMREFKQFLGSQCPDLPPVAVNVDEIVAIRPAGAADSPVTILQLAHPSEQIAVHGRYDDIVRAVSAGEGWIP